MISLGDMQFPPNLSPKVREAVAELLALVELGFTGNLSIDFKDGIPLGFKRMETRRFGAPGSPGSS